MNRCLIGDCRAILPTLEAGSVQCCVTSPPYDDLRSYGGHTWDFESTALGLYRVLVDGGVLCWNVNDSVVDGSETVTSAKQKIFFREVCGFRIHDTMIYERLNFSNPERVRYHQVFEYIFVLSKGAPRCFNPLRDKANVYAGKPGMFGKVSTKRDKHGAMVDMYNAPRTKLIEEYGMRGNVWRGPTAGQENVCEPNEHPAMMPYWLARDLIASWSNPGDIVLDPFLGSGTVGKAAQDLGRQWIGIEINEAYAKLQDKRTAQQGMVLA